MTRAFVYWLHRPEHTDPFTEGYIGVSTNLTNRLEYHYCTAKKGTHTNSHISRAFKKYGEAIHSVILEAPEDYCYEIEAKLRPSKRIGWNIAEGGHRGPDATGRVMSEEFRQDVSKRMKNVPKTEEHKRNISLAHKGKKKSPEHIENRRKAITGKPQTEKQILANKAARVDRKWWTDGVKEVWSSIQPLGFNRGRLKRD
jgi:hypothetical protein